MSAVVWNDYILTLYHVTLKSRIPYILRQGLIPNIGDLSRRMGERRKAIWLFTEKAVMEDALTNWLGDTFDGMYGLKAQESILAVNLPKTYMGKLEYNRAVGYEVVCYAQIPPRYLKVLR